MAIKPRVKVPKTAAIGEIITIKALINHPMESGQRRDRETGEKTPRMIVHTFEATFNDKQIVLFELEGGISRDPFFEFTMKVPSEGEVKFKWTDDEGAIFETSKMLAIK